MANGSGLGIPRDLVGASPKTSDNPPYRGQKSGHPHGSAECPKKSYRRAEAGAAPGTIAEFFDAKVQGAERAPATVRRYITSIGHMHRAAGFTDPTKSEVVRLALKRVGRSKGTRQQQAHGLTYDLRARMLDATDTGTVKGLRDRALLATANDTLMRRAEVVALERPHLKFAEDGIGAGLAARSKADPEGKGQLRHLAPDTVAMLQA